MNSKLDPGWNDVDSDFLAMGSPQYYAPSSILSSKHTGFNLSDIQISPQGCFPGGFGGGGHPYSLDVCPSLGDCNSSEIFTKEPSLIPLEGLMGTSIMAMKPP